MTITTRGSSLSKGLTKSPRRPDIQGLRAVAVIVVILFHAGAPIPGGFVGVDVFFVISGFVITAMLAREFGASGRIRFGQFYLRRFKRLTPALAVLVGFTMVVSTLALSPFGTQETAAQTALGAMLLGANVVIARTTGNYFDAPAEANPLLNTWSLSVEEQFYLAFPLILALCWSVARRRAGGSKLPLLVVFAIGLGSFALAVVGSSGLRHPNPYVDAVLGALLGFYSPLTRAWEFAAGALLALSVNRLRATSASRARALGVSGAALLLASLFFLSGAVPFPGVWTLLPVVGTGMLLLAGSEASNLVSRLLARTPMVKLGDWSYSLYLWHWPLIVLAKATWPDLPVAVPLAALVSFVPAYISYRWVEQPIRVMPLPSRRRAATVVGATILPALGVAGLLLVSSTHGFWIPKVVAYQAEIMPLHAGAKAGCHATGPLSASSLSHCRWNSASSGAPIYLLGDSHAEHWSEAVIAAGESLGRPVIIKTGGNCPLVDVAMVRLDAVADVNSACRSYVKGTLHYLESAPPGLVILSSADGYWVGPRVSVGLSPDSTSTDSAAKLRSLAVGLQETVGLLEQAGHKVLLVQTRPMFTGSNAWSPEGCSLMAVLSQTGCDARLPIDDALAQQGRVRRVLETVATTSGVSVLDPWPTLCPGGVCDTRHGSLLRYRDGNHVSVDQSRAMAPEFLAAIRAASG